MRKRTHTFLFFVGFLVCGLAHSGKPAYEHEKHLTLFEVADFNPQWQDLTGLQKRVEIRKLTVHQHYNLENKVLQSWILRNRHGLYSNLTPQQRWGKVLDMALETEQRSNLASQSVQTWILNDDYGFFQHLPPQKRWDMALGLSMKERRRLESRAVQTLLLKNDLGLMTTRNAKKRWHFAMALSDHQLRRLENQALQRWVFKDKKSLLSLLKFEEKWDFACSLTEEQCQNLGALASKAVNAFILWEVYGFFPSTHFLERYCFALTLSDQQRQMLEHKAIQSFIFKDEYGLCRHLRPKRKWALAMTLSDYQQELLGHGMVQKILKHKILPLSMALTLTPYHVQALYNPQIYEMLESGHLPPKIFIRPDFNEDMVIHEFIQSTHTASVHDSVSESMLRLLSRYGGDLTRDSIRQTLEGFVEGLLDTHITPAQKDIAIRGVLSLEGHLRDVYEEKTQIPMVVMLVLVAKALLDDDLRSGTYVDVMAIASACLRDIQRGYNINEKGEDDGEEDRPICPGGAFNKLIEILAGVHEDVSLIYLTHPMAMAKLPHVVREEARAFMDDITPARKTLRQKIMSIEKDDERLEALYEAIKPHVSERIMDEFGPLYGTPRNTKFRALLSFGVEALDDDMLSKGKFKDEVQRPIG